MNTENDKIMQQILNQEDLNTLQDYQISQQMPQVNSRNQQSAAKSTNDLPNQDQRIRHKDAVSNRFLSMKNALKHTNNRVMIHPFQTDNQPSKRSDVNLFRDRMSQSQFGIENMERYDYKFNSNQEISSQHLACPTQDFMFQDIDRSQIVDGVEMAKLQKCPVGDYEGGNDSRSKESINKIQPLQLEDQGEVLSNNRSSYAEGEGGEKHNDENIQ